VCCPSSRSSTGAAGFSAITLVQTAGNDVLRDEGEAYARKLDEAGVDVTAVRYEGLIHDYGLLNGLSEMPAVRDALHQAAAVGAFAPAIFLFALFLSIGAGDLFLKFALEDKGFFEMATKSHALSVFEDQDQSLPQPEC